MDGFRYLISCLDAFVVTLGHEIFEHLYALIFLLFARFRFPKHHP